MFSLIAALVLGFQHAFELDHLAGLASFSSGNFYTGVRNAAKWVASHVAVVFTAALLLFLLAPQAKVAAESFEVVVGIVLIALAANKLRHLVSKSPDVTQPHAGKLGLLHGLSGTGAFVALAFASATGVGDVVVFSTLFGVGLAAGAVAATALLFAPFASELRVHTRFLNFTYAIFTALVGFTLLV